MSERNDATPIQSSQAHTQEGLDSAATTLIASATSSKSHSFDEKRRKYASIELERHGAVQAFSRNTQDGAVGDVEDDEVGDDENAHLLAAETATVLQADPRAQETARAIELEEAPAGSQPEQKRDERVTWASLPKKGQLAIITLARLSEPLTQTSLQAYMFYQLKSFHRPDEPPPSDATVARQAGILAAAFAGAQFLTAIMWGRLADSERVGRKKVILIGLLGVTIGTLGFGFSTSFYWTVFWRCLGGALNGNVGVLRTMISEIVKEKKYQSRAFMLLPMTFNVGVIVGPLLGGILADPVGSYPNLFSKNGGGWLRTWPYALPNVVSACFLFCSAMGVLLGLKETHELLQDKPDYGLRLGQWIARTIFRRRSNHAYAPLAAQEGAAQDDIELRAGAVSQQSAKSAPRIRRKLPFRRIWTKNVICVLFAHGFLAGHVSVFNNMWYVFLSTPRYTPGAANNDGDSKTLHVPPNYRPHLPFIFTGGLALPPPSIGTALAILGVIGITLQLLLYPTVSFRLGTLSSLRLSNLLFPLTYTLTPYLAIVPSSTPPPRRATGPLIWTAITLVLLIQVTGRTFALPSTTILVNNSSPHPSVLGTVHGLAQTVSSAARTIGPAITGWIYAMGLQKGIVGLAWWYTAGIAVIAAALSWFVEEGNGHSILLEGEDGEVKS